MMTMMMVIIIIIIFIILMMIIKKKKKKNFYSAVSHRQGRGGRTPRFTKSVKLTNMHISLKKTTTYKHNITFLAHHRHTHTYRHTHRHTHKQTAYTHTHTHTHTHKYAGARDTNATGMREGGEEG